MYKCGLVLSIPNLNPIICFFLFILMNCLYRKHILHYWNFLVSLCVLNKIRTQIIPFHIIRSSSSLYRCTCLHLHLYAPFWLKWDDRIMESTSCQSLQNTMFEGNALKNSGPIGKREDEQRRDERSSVCQVTWYFRKRNYTLRIYIFSLLCFRRLLRVK